MGEESGLDVAVKLLHSGKDNSRFIAEFERLKQLSNDRSILEVVDGNLSAQTPYFITRLYLNGTLEKKCVIGQGTASVKERVAWFETVASALKTAHRHGILHGDLKPSNVLLDDDERVRLADFGQSTELEEGGGLLGSLGFMCPEQALCRKSGQAPDTSWDVYALGALAYRLFTGEFPRLSGEEVAALHDGSPLSEQIERYVAALRTKPLKKVSELNSEIDPELSFIIESCLALDPELRPNAVSEVLDDIGRWRRGEPLLCRRPWSLGYRAGKALRLPQVKVAFFLLTVLTFAVVNYVHDIREKNQQLTVRRGIEAANAGRFREAYLLWADALIQDPADEVLRMRLAQFPYTLNTIVKLPGRVSAVSFDSNHTDRQQNKALPSRFAAGAESGYIGVWDSRSGDLLSEHSMPGAIEELDFAGDRLWARSGDTLAVWEGLEWKEFTKDGGEVKLSDNGQLAWKEDLSKLPNRSAGAFHLGRLGRWATVRVAGGVRLFDLESREERFVKARSDDFRFATMTAVDGPRVLLVDADGVIKEDQVGVIPMALKPPSTGLPERVEMDPWKEDRVAFLYRDKSVDILFVLDDLKKLEFVKVYPQRLSEIRFLNGNHLMLRPSKGSPQLLSSSTGAALTLPQQPGVVTALDATSPNILVTGDTDGLVRVWTMREEMNLEPLTAESNLNLVRFDANAQFFYSDNSGRLVHHPDGENWWPEHESNIRSWDSHGSDHALGDNVGEVRVVNADRKVLFEDSGVGEVTSLSMDSKTLLIVRATLQRSEIELTEIDSSEALWQRSIEGRVVCSAIHSRFAVLGTEDGAVLALDRASGEEVGRWLVDPNAPVRELEMLAGGRWVAVAGNGFSILPDGDSGRHHGQINCLQMGPKRSIFATGSEDGTARLWSAKDGASRTAPLYHPSPVVRCAFSADGRWLACGTVDGDIVLWETATGRQASPNWSVGGKVIALDLRGGVLRYVTETGAHGQYVLQAAQADPETLQREIENNVGAYLDHTGSLLPIEYEKLRERLKGGKK